MDSTYTNEESHKEGITFSQKNMFTVNTRSTIRVVPERAVASTSMSYEYTSTVCLSIDCSCRALRTRSADLCRSVRAVS